MFDLCKPEVRGSIPLCSTKSKSLPITAGFLVCKAPVDRTREGKTARWAVF